MSHARRRSVSRQATSTPTPSRPGTPSSSSRRPSFRTNNNSIPSLALANATLISSASAPQVSTNQVLTLPSTHHDHHNNNGNNNGESGNGNEGDLLTVGSESSGLLAIESHQGSSENVHLMVVDEQGTPDTSRTNTLDLRSLRPPEDVAADAHKLRDHLRKSLGRTSGGRERSRSHVEPARIDIQQLDYEEPPKDPATPPVAPHLRRQFFVLTHAGKPVFTNRPEPEAAESDDVTNLIGVMHALISVFEDDQDKIRSIIAPPVRITFSLRPPLYYMCVTPFQEPESVARIYLEHLHLLILSVLTGSQLERILTRHTNFDLRRLLSGTSTMLQTHLLHLPTSFAILTSSLSTLRLESSLRLRVADAIVPPTNMKARLKDVLYALVIVNERVVTIARPKKHTVHPTDIHVLLATIGSPAVKGNSASWLPICLPKFNASGLLHAYVSYLEMEPEPAPIIASTSTSTLTKPDDDAAGDAGTEEVTEAEAVEPAEEEKEPPPPSICLALVSVSGDFESVREWSDVATRRLQENDTLRHLIRAAHKSSYSVDELGIPGLRHFCYKSRPNVQVTSPFFEGIEVPDSGEVSEEQKADEWETLFGLYRMVWDAIHAKSGQECTLKLQYVRTERVSVMGWITQTFELYVALSPRIPKSAAVSAANAVVKWVKQEESRIFLKDAPVF